MAITDNIGYLLQHTASSLARQSDQLLQDHLDIGFSQFKIMMVLQWNPNLRQRDIADNLGQTEASISRQIRLMHDEGLLKTTISPENKREHITTLTPRGEQLTDKASLLLNKYYEPIFGCLSEHQQRQFAHSIGAMHNEVCHGGCK